MSPAFHFKIDLPYHAVKKNNRPIHGRGLKKWIGKSDRLKNAEHYLTSMLMDHRIMSGYPKPLTGDLHAVFIFTFEEYFTKKGERARTLPDLSNLLELPADCLQEAGIIQNDSDICLFDGSCRLPGKKNQLEIFLYVLKDSVYQRHLKESHLGAIAG